MGGFGRRCPARPAIFAGCGQSPAGEGAEWTRRQGCAARRSAGRAGLGGFGGARSASLIQSRSQSRPGEFILALGASSAGGESAGGGVVSTCLRRDLGAEEEARGDLPGERLSLRLFRLCLSSYARHQGRDRLRGEGRIQSCCP
uniref:Uncharacterized protein n=1 Tax=Sphaerodactylus townsendi TaxID=933632 RepID=A0ACB8G8B9_9SAUR